MQSLILESNLLFFFLVLEVTEIMDCSAEAACLMMLALLQHWVFLQQFPFYSHSETQWVSSIETFTP